MEAAVESYLDGASNDLGSLAHPPTQVMVHENDPTKDGCPFSRFFQTTPMDLIADGLYKTIAVAMHTGPHREVITCFNRM